MVRALEDDRIEGRAPAFVVQTLPGSTDHLQRLTIGNRQRVADVAPGRTSGNSSVGAPPFRSEPIRVIRRNSATLGGDGDRKAPGSRFTAVLRWCPQSVTSNPTIQPATNGQRPQCSCRWHVPRRPQLTRGKHEVVDFD